MSALNALWFALMGMLALMLSMLVAADWRDERYRRRRQDEEIDKKDGEGR